MHSLWNLSDNFNKDLTFYILGDYLFYSVIYYNKFVNNSIYGLLDLKIYIFNNLYLLNSLLNDWDLNDSLYLLNDYFFNLLDYYFLNNLWNFNYFLYNSRNDHNFLNNSFNFDYFWYLNHFLYYFIDLNSNLFYSINVSRDLYNFLFDVSDWFRYFNIMIDDFLYFNKFWFVNDHRLS